MARPTKDRLPKKEYFRQRLAECEAQGNTRKADYFRQRLESLIECAIDFKSSTGNYWFTDMMTFNDEGHLQSFLHRKMQEGHKEVGLHFKED